MFICCLFLFFWGGGGGGAFLVQVTRIGSQGLYVCLLGWTFLVNVAKI